jgi:tetrahydromethanopterin:alpha-L-glutamate ligase
MAETILILSDRIDRQVRQLRTALGKRGLNVMALPLADIGFDSRYPSGIDVPGMNGALPAAAIVRSISSGTFEAITRRLGILHAFHHLGVPVWNSAKAVERCVDKSTTTFFLTQAGLPAPETFAVESLANARAVAERELAKGPLVLKPLFGSQGRGIRLIREMEDLPAPEEIDDVYYLQRFVARPGPPFCDYRVFTCAGRMLGMMERRAGDWITNIAKGAKAQPVAGILRAELEKLALAASAAIGTDFAGVDIIPAQDGRLLVLEVNSMPAWTGLQSVVPIKIAENIADALVSQIASGSYERPAA